MKIINSIFFLVIGALLILSCEVKNPYGPSYDEAGNLAKDKIKIDEYLAKTPIDSLYRIYDPSGVVVIVQEEGNGTKPKTNNIVYINYVGRLLDNFVFDTNIESVARANDIFEASRSYRVFDFVQGSSSVIPGYTFGFRNLRSGSKAVILIPSPFAYRDATNNPRIPANSVLRFDVEFLGLD
jgi:FKBP-type peptidyl-prolyl cis-trans isomerase FkpA